MEKEKNNSEKLIGKNISNTVILGAIIIAIAILVSYSGYDTVISYTAGVSNDTLMNVNIVSPVNDDGNVRVLNQDYTGEVFNFFITRQLSNTTLLSKTEIGDMVLNVVDTTGCADFRAVNVYDNESYFQGIIMSTTANTITMGSEIDRSFNVSNTIVECGEWNISSVDGSVTDQIYRIIPPSDRVWHVISTSVVILDDTQMEDDEFGGIPALTNGLSMRIKDGYTKDVFLIYNNIGFFLRGFDYLYSDRFFAGTYGFRSRLNIKDIHGAVIELDGSTDDEIQAVVRDDLTPLLEMAITVQGHYVTDFE